MKHVKAPTLKNIVNADALKTRTTQTFVLMLLILSAVMGIMMAIKPAEASNASQNKNLSIAIKGIAQPKGDILIAIYDKASEFNNSTQNIHSFISLKATKSTLKVTFKDFPKGRYAVSVLHDINGNGFMDYGKDQLPSEAYAFSKNVGTMSVPTFEDAEFTHSSKTALTLNMVQPL